MRFLAILNPKAHATEADFRRHSLEEEKRVWALYSGDVIRQMYFQPEPIRVALVFEAASADEVRGHVDTFPMVQARLFDVDVMHLGPWLPIAALFGPQAGGAPS
jgi:hypothetical protein